ncbi:GIY-YIG nuclease family protein [Maricaulis virginensis]|jgi:putative endonuclease|uniref:Endonuclease n=1 Tax=Maricaulis virginensis TaxID=144022 RepID=A0A9W6MMQ3_9PROT|nr:GIY-YIG nuclease family protein [Maricaulis virginensis]GLK51417.1 endonuclease [Maricaulis virginensis]|tara:strand:- start:247 stop:588 length:342 start_codon:yes stop_codon:yes gene_type:complete
MSNAPEAVYIMASRPRGALYVGRTTNLIWRIWQHRTGAMRGYTRRYAIKQLVWFEWHEGFETAARREYLLKRWRRAWKINLIEAMNPGWKDLWFDIRGDFDEAAPVLASAPDT